MDELEKILYEIGEDSAKNDLNKIFTKTKIGLSIRGYEENEYNVLKSLIKDGYEWFNKNSVIEGFENDFQIKLKENEKSLIFKGYSNYMKLSYFSMMKKAIAMEGKNDYY